MGEQQVEGYSTEGEVQPGPRIVMSKTKFQNVGGLVRFAVNENATDEESYLTTERWEQLGSPEKIEVRLEAF